jgi:hypothetical protein
MKNILNQITEAQVRDWLKARLLEIRRDHPHVCRVDFDVSVYSDRKGPEVIISAHSREPSAIGYGKATIADALTELQVDIDSKPDSAAALRKEACDILKRAQEMDGKPAFITFEPHGDSARAEAQKEGRLMPKSRPNPHDA